MGLPQFGEKGEYRSVMTPGDRLQQRFHTERERPIVPARCLLVLHDGLFDRATAGDGATPIDVGTDTYAVAVRDVGPTDVGIVGEFGVGAPALAIVVEELVALGARQLLVVGGCGTIQETVSPGDAIVVSGAIRDEGTSHHYVPPAPVSHASPSVTDALETTMDRTERRTHRGITWTTDGFYRETAAEVEHYRDRGVLAVEMEAAALFAIASYREVEAGALLTPFDRLGDDGWAWDIDADPGDVLEALLASGIDALASGPAPSPSGSDA